MWKKADVAQFAVISQRLQDLSFPRWCCRGFSLLGHHTVVLHEWFLHEMTRGPNPQQIKYPSFMTEFSEVNIYFKV
jgi:hypothetical protein